MWLHARGLVFRSFGSGGGGEIHSSVRDAIAPLSLYLDDREENNRLRPPPLTK